MISSKISLNSHFDYCSSLLIFVERGSFNRLDKCFRKAFNQVVGVKLASSTDISAQFEQLNSFGSLPLGVRYFQRYCVFLFRLFAGYRVPGLVDRVPRVGRSGLRHGYLLGTIRSDYGRYRFSTVAAKLLNLFISGRLSDSEASFKYLLLFPYCRFF